MAMTVAVMDLVQEPRWNWSSMVTGSGLPYLRTPTAPSATVRSLVTMAPASAGRSYFCRIGSSSALRSCGVFALKSSFSTLTVPQDKSSPPISKKAAHRSTVTLTALTGCINLHDLPQKPQGIRLGTLEGVAPDDGAEAAALFDGAYLGEQRLIRLLRAAREDDDAPPVEGTLHDVAYPLRQRSDGDMLALVDLAGLVLLDMGDGQLDFNEMRAQLRGDVGRVAGHVDGRLALFAQAGPARIGPDDDDQAVALGFGGVGADLLVHVDAVERAGIDGKANAHAAEPQGVGHAAGQRLVGILLIEQDVVIVGLEDEGNVAGKLPCARLQKAQGRGVGVAAGFDSQLEMIAWIVGGRIRSEAARRAMLEALVYRQDDQLSGAGQPAGIQQTRQVGQGAGIIAPVPAQDFAHTRCHDVSCSFLGMQTLGDLEPKWERRQPEFLADAVLCAPDRRTSRR